MIWVIAILGLLTAVIGTGYNIRLHKLNNVIWIELFKLLDGSRRELSKEERAKNLSEALHNLQDAINE